MYICHYRHEWPASERDHIDTLAQLLEGRLGGVRGEAFLKPADESPAPISVFVVLPGERDWRLEVPLDRVASAIDIDALTRALRAGAELADAWVLDGSESALTSVVERELGPCVKVGDRVWESRGVIVGDVAHIWGTFGSGEGLPVATPAFRRHFTDPLYESETSEFAPFGSDEGNDLVREWGERRDRLQLGLTAAVADLLEGIDPNNIEGDDVDEATLVVAAGFALLRLTGRIDRAGRRQTLKALRVLADFYDSPPEIEIMTRDLREWQM